MTRWSFEILSEAHNQELLELATQCDTGSTEFRVDRAPDYYALCRYWGTTQSFGLRHSGRLSACLSVTNQKRWLEGRPTMVPYLHDLRVHPEDRGSMALFRLIRGALRVQRPTWLYTTILGSNGRALALEAALARTLGGFRALGETGHWGLPCKETDESSVEVRELAEYEWEREFDKHSAARDFTPADPSLWRNAGGRYLLAVDSGRRQAVCKLVDEGSRRRILIASGEGAEGTFHHGHLAFYAGLREETIYRALAAFAARETAFLFAFAGLPLHVARGFRRAGDLLLGSRTRAAGIVPETVELAHHELLLL